MWVKLTDYDGEDIYVNLDRFDRIKETTYDNGISVTRIIATLSVTEEDSLIVDVREKPEHFVPLMRKSAD